MSTTPLKDLNPQQAYKRVMGNDRKPPKQYGIYDASVNDLVFRGEPTQVRQYLQFQARNRKDNLSVLDYETETMTPAGEWLTANND